MNKKAASFVKITRWSDASIKALFDKFTDLLGSLGDPYQVVFDNMDDAKEITTELLLAMPDETRKELVQEVDRIRQAVVADPS